MQGICSGVCRVYVVLCAGMLNGDFNVAGGTGSCECNGETG